MPDCVRALAAAKGLLQRPLSRRDGRQRSLDRPGQAAPAASVPARPFERRPRVVWVTNYAAPYRIPLWDRLSRRCDLTVLVFGDYEPQRAWRLSDAAEALPHVDFRLVPAMHVTWAKHDLSLHVPRDLALPREVARLRPAVIVIGGWDSPAYWATLVLAKSRRVATVLFHESSLTSSRFDSGPVASLRKRIFTSADTTLGMGVAAREAALAQGVAEENAFTAFNIAGGPYLRPPPEPQGSKVSGHVFLFVGRLIPLKQVDLLIRCFAAVRSPGDELHIVGDGPERTNLEALARDLGVAEPVRFLGHLTGAELLAAYDGADTLVLPSQREVWGMVVNEALARGLHVVVSERAGVAASVAHMRGVSVCRPEAQPLEAAMRELRDARAPRIRDPEILEITADRVADAAFAAITAAMARQHG